VDVTKLNQESIDAFLQAHRLACGRRLQLARMADGKRQSDLALAAGVTQQLISYAEAGHRDVRLEARMRICGALGVKHDDIWPAPNVDSFLAAGRTQS
jgi:transcriptional regulator with XRE-family HTH domain